MDNALAERILSAAHPVVLLTGPAASGKTTAALAVYRAYADDACPSRCLLLAPNAPAAAHLRRRLLDRSPNGVVISPNVMTFAALAAGILAAAPPPGAAEPAAWRPIRAFERNLLLRRIVDELCAEGVLTALSAVADTPGLVRALDRAIAELKRAAVEPDELARAVGRGRGRNRDLLAVYRRYQQRLQDSGRHDVEGRMWLARDRLENADDPCGLADCDAVVVDGFTDFTPTQLDILRLLSARTQRVLITLCCADDGRGRMWHWTHRTRDNVRRAFGQELAEVAVERADDAPLAPLWRRLFDLDAGRCRPPPALHVTAAADVDAEVAAAARRVKRLLLDGAPPGSIAVTARSLDVYRGAVERIFAEHDIPVAPAPQPLTDVGIVRFLLALADLGEQFAFQDVLRVIKNSYFVPAALGEFDAAAPAAAETVIREGNVLDGRANYARAAERLARRLAQERQREEDDEDEEDGAPRPRRHRPSGESIASAASMLERLFDLAESVRAPAGGGVVPSALADLIEQLRLPAAAVEGDDAARIARDLRALAVLDSALRSAGDGALRLADLRGALSCVACPPARSESLVDCLDVLDARALRYRHVFCLGLREGGFPRHVAEQPLLNESDRRAWSGRGVRLDSRSDLAAREMLLFYLAVSRADRTLWLSYVESGGSREPGAPSPFLLRLVEPLGGLDELAIERIPPGRFLPPADELACRRDAAAAAVVGLFRPDLCRPDAALTWAGMHARGAIVRSAAALWARRRRWTPGECGAFDGRLADNRHLAALAERYPHREVFSASQLNAYGQCPWQYFARYVLHLEPLAAPQRRLEPAARGIFVHNVLARVMAALRGAAGGPVRLPQLAEDTIRQALDRAMAAESAAVEARTVPYPVLWDLQRRQMGEAILDYLLRAREGDELESACLHFELGFAATTELGEVIDPASVSEPVALLTPAGPIRVKGKIDRVDRVRFGGEAGLLVVDYKTGGLPSERDILDGRNLQLPIYAAVAEAVLRQRSFGGAFHRVGKDGRRFFAAMKPRSRGGGYVAVDEFGQLRKRVQARIGAFIESMRAGRFDVLPTHDCPAYCPYRQICRHSPARARAKAAPPADDEPGTQGRAEGGHS